MKQNRQRRDEILYKMIIERMKDLRNSHNHSQEYVVENTKLDISHFETGRSVPSLTSISIFCKFYNITLDDFFAPLAYPPKE